MRIVVDTNIVFSAMLNTNSRISRILLQPKSQLNFYSTNQLSLEISNHSDKLKAISEYSDSEMAKISTWFHQRIRFIDVKSFM